MNHRRRKCRWFVAGLAALFLRIPSSAAALSPLAFHALELRARAVLNERSAERAAEIFHTQFGMHEFAERCFSDYWTTLTVLQREEYRYLFTTLLERNLTNRFHAIATQRTRYTQHLQRVVQNDDNTWSAYVAFRSARYHGQVEYVFSADPTHLELIDYVIDNVSLSRNYRGHFNHVMRTRGFGAVLADLQQKISTLAATPDHTNDRASGV